MTIEDKLCYHRHILDEGRNRSDSYQEVIIEEFKCETCEGLNLGCDGYLFIQPEVRNKLMSGQLVTTAQTYGIIQKREKYRPQTDSEGRIICTELDKKYYKGGEGI